MAFGLRWWTVTRNESKKPEWYGDNKALVKLEEEIAMRGHPVPEDIAKRILELAEAQCTEGEIAGAIAFEWKVGLHIAEGRVRQMRDEILVASRHAKAEARCRMRQASLGLIEMDRNALAALEVFGKQHLGYSATGVDTKIRKLVEQLEKDGTPASAATDDSEHA